MAYLAIQDDGALTGTMAEPVVTKYYYFGGQRVAMRQCDDSVCEDPVYLHSDHLGSASLATDNDGELISDMRYYPYGATRSGTVETDYRFTGQRAEPIAGGIYDYRARYYDARLQWIQPDTIVPDFSNPQSLNRYAYVLNNPLRYNDPTGYIEESEQDDASGILARLRKYGVNIVVDWGWFLSMSGDETVWDAGMWKLSELSTVLKAALDFAGAAGGVEAAREAISGARIERVKDGRPTAHWGQGHITIADYTFTQKKNREIMGPRIAIVHELAHYWDWKSDNIVDKLLRKPGEMVQGLPTVNYGPTAWGRSSPTEAWAESVAVYVYPVYIDILKAEGIAVENFVKVPFKYPGLTPPYKYYVERRFEELKVSK